MPRRKGNAELNTLAKSGFGSAGRVTVDSPFVGRCRRECKNDPICGSDVPVRTKLFSMDPGWPLTMNVDGFLLLAKAPGYFTEMEYCTLRVYKVGIAKGMLR